MLRAGLVPHGEVPLAGRVSIFWSGMRHGKAPSERTSVCLNTENCHKRQLLLCVDFLAPRVSVPSPALQLSFFTVFVTMCLTLGPMACLPFASSKPVASCLAGATSPLSSSAKSGSHG